MTRITPPANILRSTILVFQIVETVVVVMMLVVLVMVVMVVLL